MDLAIFFLKNKVLAIMQHQGLLCAYFWYVYSAVFPSHHSESISIIHLHYWTLNFKWWFFKGLCSSRQKLRDYSNFFIIWNLSFYSISDIFTFATKFFSVVISLVWLLFFSCIEVTLKKRKSEAKLFLWQLE